jgi:DNA ligase (NAD+)
MTQTEEDQKPESAAEGILAGKTILFTGALQQFTREKAEAAAAAAGATLVSGVSSKLNILVVGEKAGSKLEKAKKLGTVQILTEQEFVELVAM